MRPRDCDGGGQAGNVTVHPSVARRHLLLTAALALTTLGTGLLAWRQQRELTELRSRGLDQAERAKLQKRVWELEKSNRELQASAERPPPEPTGAKPAPGTVPRPARGESGRANAQQQLAFVRELLSRPEVESYVNLQQRQRVEASYAALFRNLGLDARQCERLTGLLLERQNLRGEVAEAARAQGIDPRQDPEGMRRLLATAREDLETAIRGVIGPAGFSALEGYDATLTQRGVVGELQQRLGAVGDPLSGAQSEQLVRILAKNPVPGPATAAPGTATPSAATGEAQLRAPDLGPVLAGLVGGGSGPAIAASIFAPMPGGGALISDAALVEAQPLLSASQLTALQRLQRQQQAQQEVQRVVRESLSSANRPAAAAPAAPTPKR